MEPKTRRLAAGKGNETRRGLEDWNLLLELDILDGIDDDTRPRDSSGCRPRRRRIGGR